MKKLTKTFIKEKNGIKFFKISGYCPHKNWQWINPIVKMCMKCKRTQDMMPEMKPDWGNWDKNQVWGH